MDRSAAGAAAPAIAPLTTIPRTSGDISNVCLM